MAGQSITTETFTNTTNPHFATSLVFKEVELPKAPELTAPLEITLYDHDTWGDNDKLGGITVPLALSRQTAAAFQLIERELTAKVEQLVSDLRTARDARGGVTVAVGFTTHKECSWVYVSCVAEHASPEEIEPLFMGARADLKAAVRKAIEDHVVNVPIREALSKEVPWHTIPFVLVLASR